jgi:predicted nucleic acid-binding protein
MANYFFDSSALVKRYVEEPGSAWVDELIQRSPPGSVLLSRLAELEVVSALVRRSRAGDLCETELKAAVGLLKADLDGRFEIIELSRAPMTRAVDVVRTHALRAADAIQLSSALIAKASRSSGSDFALVSADMELNEAAKKEGMKAINPADLET